MPKNLFDVDFGIGKPKRSRDLFGLGIETSKKPSSGKISKSLRDQVWMKYMGNKAQGKCYCCRIRPIHYTDFQVGHNKARAKGGKNNISNLRPICGPCNRGMRIMSIEQYRKKHFTKPTKSKRSSKKGATKRKTATPFGFEPIKLPRFRL